MELEQALVVSQVAKQLCFSFIEPKALILKDVRITHGVSRYGPVISLEDIYRDFGLHGQLQEVLNSQNRILEDLPWRRAK